MVLLTPAYGRDYRTKDAVHEAFLLGKDFILHDPSSRWDGKPCSIRDLVGKTVEINYNANGSVWNGGTCVEVKSRDEIEVIS